MTDRKQNAENSYTRQAYDFVTSHKQKRKSDAAQVSDVTDLLEFQVSMIDEIYGKPQRPTKEYLGD